MNKKSIVVWIIIILSLCLGVLIGFYFYIKNTAPNSDNPNNQNGGISFFGTSTPQNRPLGTGSSSINSDTFSIGTTTGFARAEWRVLWDRPTSAFGFVTIETKDISTTTNRIVTFKEEVIRLVDRETGNIQQTSTSTNLLTRISNTTYPRTETGFFLGSSGSELFLQRLEAKGEKIESSYSSLKLLTTTSTSQTLTTKAFTDDILFSSPSPDGTKIAHVTSNPNERLITTKNDGTGKVVLWSSQLSEFIPYWINKDSIILQSKASFQSPTYVYSINPNTKSIKKLTLGGNNYPGLTATVRSDLKKAIISYLDNKGDLVTSIRNLDSIDESRLYVSTLAEKCIWSKKNIDIVLCAAPETPLKGAFPDVWYQGRTSFSDNIWKINTSTGETRLIFRPYDYLPFGIDIQKLQLDKNEDYLIFQNKDDLSIWGLEVEIESPVKTTR